MEAESAQQPLSNESLSAEAAETNTTSNNSARQISATLTATAPGQLKVIKRNGTVVPYNDEKITLALTKAFLAVEGGMAAVSPRIREVVAEMTTQVTNTFERRLPSGGTLHIEEIQDQVELALMRSGEHQVARDYVLYREEHARLRATKNAVEEQQQDQLSRFLVRMVQSLLWT